ncbi:putative nuclease HARBI1 [Heptranchias perlo]|uniref:putative nuclease HARBI1 n=1 Tax=Heptranchias perlo TaxID=212740 RepID=UPI00355A5AD4
MGAKLGTLFRRYAASWSSKMESWMHMHASSMTMCQTPSWIRWLRFAKEVVTEICHLLQPQLQPQSRARTALPVAVKVNVVLNFYGSGSFRASVGDLCNISQFAVHCCIREVTEAQYKMHNRFITFPFDREKQNESAQGFARFAGFSMVQAAIDCTHIAMRASHLNLAIFMNRKGFHSLNAQLVCDHTHPRQVKGWLLGDKGYPLMRWLMTLMRHARSHAEQAYNDSHAATRNIVKHTVGLLKQCFRCLDRSDGALQYSAERMSRFVVCCMLHNLALMRVQPLSPPIQQDPEPEAGEEEEEAEEEEEEEEEDARGQQGTQTLSARALRAHLIRARYQ